MKFNLESTSGKVVSLEDYKGKNLVLYFYPKDNTPGCTVEAQDFASNYEKFKELNTEVLGISKDSIKSHNKFKEKFSLPFELLSDEEREVHGEFDVLKEKNMFGKKAIGTVRSTFIFNANGDLVKEFRDVKVKGHVEEVLEYIKENL